jgi:hypothetical protein
LTKGRENEVAKRKERTKWKKTKKNKVAQNIEKREKVNKNKGRKCRTAQ